MLISIIIVNWNTRELILKCLESIYEYPPTGEFEIWVVDNASTDGSADAIREHFPEIQLIASQENLGFAEGNNIALDKATGKYMLLLNPDAEVREGALDALIRFMEENPEAGAAGPLTLNSDLSLQVSCYPFPTLFRELWRLFHLDQLRPFGIYRMEQWETRQPRRVEVLQGACMILRKEAIEQIGVLDQDYFIYTEEVDLCYRLNKGKWHLYWVPEATVIHHAGKSTNQIAPQMFLQLYRSKILYFRKHHGLFGAWGYKLILILASLARLALVPVAWVFQKSERGRQLELSRNYFWLLVKIPSM